MRFLLPFLLVALLAGSTSADLVRSMPGLAEMPSFKMYAGHIQVNATMVCLRGFRLSAVGVRRMPSRFLSCMSMFGCRS